MKEFFGSGKNGFSAGGLLADDALDAVSGGVSPLDPGIQPMKVVNNPHCPWCGKSVALQELVDLLNAGKPAVCPSCQHEGTLDDFCRD